MTEPSGTTSQNQNLNPNPKTVATALRLLLSQRKAARAYYQRNTDAMKARSAA